MKERSNKYGNVMLEKIGTLCGITHNAIEKTNMEYDEPIITKVLEELHDQLKLFFAGSGKHKEVG